MVFPTNDLFGNKCLFCIFLVLFSEKMFMFIYFLTAYRKGLNVPETSGVNFFIFIFIFYVISISGDST